MIDFKRKVFDVDLSLVVLKALPFHIEIANSLSYHLREISKSHYYHYYFNNKIDMIWYSLMSRINFVYHDQMKAIYSHKIILSFDEEIESLKSLISSKYSRRKNHRSIVIRKSQYDWRIQIELKSYPSYRSKKKSYQSLRRVIVLRNIRNKNL